MNLRVSLLPLKILALVAMVFVSTVEMVLLLAGVLFLLVAIPKISSMISMVLYSGYMCSSAGIVYIVDEKEREKALGQGFKEVSLFTSAALTGEIKEWHFEE